MHTKWRTTLLWPGLAGLWFAGSWSALAVALAAAAAVDALLLATFGWSELAGPNVRITLWAALGLFWIVAAGWSLKRWNNFSGRSGDEFPAAVDHYLRGDYFQAERVLGGLLRRDARDIEARLMLATLFRHTGRLAEATRELEVLSRFEDAKRWQWEIQRERELVSRLRDSNVAAA